MSFSCKKTVSTFSYLIDFCVAYNTQFAFTIALTLKVQQSTLFSLLSFEENKA